MAPTERSALVLDLVRALRNQGSWAGETHVQKAAYILQQLLDVPTGFKFVLYKHGPFSFDLREALSQMEADHLIQLEEQPYPYGPKIAEGRAAGRLTSGVPEGCVDYAKKIEFISKELGSSNVADLERLATALLIYTDGTTKPNDRLAKLLQLKPHVKATEAEIAFRRLEEIRDSAKREAFTTTF